MALMCSRTFLVQPLCLFPIKHCNRPRKQLRDTILFKILLDNEQEESLLLQKNWQLTILFTAKCLWLRQKHILFSSMWRQSVEGISTNVFQAKNPAPSFIGIQ